MSWIFEVIDKSGRAIHLSKNQWSHIIRDHPEAAPFLELFKETLQSPTKIIAYSSEQGIFYYYKYFKRGKAPQPYLLIIVKYLNHHGFIITAYFVRHAYHERIYLL